jgi:hypothetical protein
MKQGSKRVSCQETKLPCYFTTPNHYSIISTDVGVDCDDVFDLQAEAVHNLLSERCKSYVVSVQQKLGLKLQLH